MIWHIISQMSYKYANSLYSYVPVGHKFNQPQTQHKLGCLFLKSLLSIDLPKVLKYNDFYNK